MYATNLLEEKILNAFRGITFTAPAKIYAGYYISNPGETGTGVEITYPGYKRQQIVFSPPAASEADYGAKAIGIKNTNQITFPKSDTDAGTATHIGILDSETGGNMLLYGKLTDDLKIDAGQAPTLLQGEVKYSLTGNFSTLFKTKVLNTMRGQNLEGFSPHLALYNGSPESGGAELSGDNYARAAVTYGAPEESQSGQMVIKSSTTTQFNSPTTRWGVWNYNVYMNAASGGEPVLVEEKLPAEVLNRNYMPLAEAGQLRVAVN